MDILYLQNNYCTHFHALHGTKILMGEAHNNTNKIPSCDQATHMWIYKETPKHLPI